MIILHNRLVKRYILSIKYIDKNDHDNDKTTWIVMRYTLSIKYRDDNDHDDNTTQSTCNEIHNTLSIKYKDNHHDDNGKQSNCK
jgi:hypothetical protein